MRYLIIAVLVIIAVLLIRRVVSRQRDLRNGPGNTPPVASMVQCRICGIYLPQDDAIRQGAFHYCSEAHRKLDSAD